MICSTYPETEMNMGYHWRNYHSAEVC